MREFHYLWGQLNTEERKAWLIKLRGNRRKYTFNWAFHIITIILFIASVIILTIQRIDLQHLIIAIIGGYAIAINYYIIRWITDGLKRE